MNAPVNAEVETGLKAEGFRFLVNPDGKGCDWIHPAEVNTRPGWTDCTDMNDAEFDAFMGVVLPVGVAA